MKDRIDITEQGVNLTARYLPSHGGWLAFRFGKVVRTKGRALKVFRTSGAALDAARKSTMDCITR